MEKMYYISCIFLIHTQGSKSFAFVDDVYFSNFSHTLSLLDLMSSCGIRVMQKPREAYLIAREPLGIKKKEEM